MKSKSKNSKSGNSNNPFKLVGNAGETHQSSDVNLTTNQGTVISDNQNSLRSTPRGPTLLEDFVMREKITHFDHERIPERIVHARGSGAHGYFQPYKSASSITKASFLQDPKKKTPVFARFSTVAGGAGSGDLPRDVRGFAVKFYTDAGNFDLVGNNIPVFFIQDAMKFPDLVHSVKMEADRGFPQAASAHDTFWDFVSLMPESMHMVIWAMSDRAIPRSLRMIEGFGVHTFRFINEKEQSKFVKFHWRPILQATSVVWDEAVKINGADPDFHRRDLWESIEKGNFPEWEFSVQVFDEKTAEKFEFDVLDPTKVIPEELVPLTPLGKMVLNKNPDNFFAETEQVAFHPGHVVPGIDFTADPLLQGRLFSYTDTQLSRLGGPNFHEIPINRPRCPMHNFQRDGMARMDAVPGRANYEPNSIALAGPRENASEGFKSFPQTEDGGESGKVRVRSETFSDHYSQARMFFASMSEPEKNHIISAYTFELSKVSIPAVRKRVLGHLMLIDKVLGESVAEGLGMPGEADSIKPARNLINLKPSPSLSLIKKFKPTLEGRKVGILVSNKVDADLLNAFKTQIQKEGATAAIIAPTISGIKDSKGKAVVCDEAISGAPSVLFDTVVLLPAKAAGDLAKNPATMNFIRDAFNHLKFIAFNPDAKSLIEKAQIKVDEAVVQVSSASDVKGFLNKAKNLKLWARENI